MLKTYKKITPSQRQLCLINKQYLLKKILLNRILIKKQKYCGRNHHGVITVRHKGAGLFNRYRIIYARNNLYQIPAKIITTEYNPFTSNFINLVYYINGVFCYISSVHTTNTLQNVYTYCNVHNKLNIGDRTLLKYINFGAQINNIQQPKLQTQLNCLIKTAGSFGILLRIKKNKAIIKLPSSTIISISYNCFATIGINNNKMHKNINYGKAGRIRLLGIRPTVRGVAMNPVDHPHGGGEGKKTKKAHPRTPWGKQS